MAATLLDCAINVYMTSVGMSSGNDKLLREAFGRMCLMGSLGTLTLVTGWRASLWAFIVLEAMTASVGLVVTFFNLADWRRQLLPEGLIMFAAFAVPAFLAFIGRKAWPRETAVT